MRTDPAVGTSWSPGAEAADCTPPERRPKKNRTPMTARTRAQPLPLVNRCGGRQPVPIQPRDGCQSSKFRTIWAECEFIGEPRSGLLGSRGSADHCFESDAA